MSLADAKATINTLILNLFKYFDFNCVLSISDDQKLCFIAMLLKYFAGETVDYVFTVHCYDLLFSH